MGNIVACQSYKKILDDLVKIKMTNDVYSRYNRYGEEISINDMLDAYNYYASKYEFIHVIEKPVEDIIFNGKTYTARAQAVKFNPNREEKKKEKAICCILLPIVFTYKDCVSYTYEDCVSYISIINIEKNKDMEIE